MKNKLKVWLSTAVILLLSLNIFYFSKYIYKLFLAFHYVEPAENENTYLIHIFKELGSVPSPDKATLVKNGIISIYPSFYHQLASFFPFSALNSGRLLSFILFIFFAVFFYFYTFKKTNSYLWALYAPLIVLGASPQFSYFFMSRVDALYLAAGWVAIIAADNFETYKENKIQIAHLLVSALGASISLVTKQTGAVFVAICFMSILIASVKNKKIWPITLFTVFSISIVGLYYAYADHDFIYKYKFGIILFGNKFDLPWAKYHLAYISKEYMYIPLFVVALVSLIQSIKNKRFFQRDLLGIILLLLVVAKTWGNLAAFNNNFFMLNFAVLYFLINRMVVFTPEAKTLSLFFITLGFAMSTFTPKFGPNIFNLNKNLIVDRDSSPIMKYVENHKGEYMTSRADYYPLANNSIPLIEWSVGSMQVAAPDIFKNDVELFNHVRLLNNSISTKLFNKEIKGVIVGMQGQEMLNLFPEILQNYKMETKERVYNGIFEITMTLYTPKQNTE